MRDQIRLLVAFVLLGFWGVACNDASTHPTAQTSTPWFSDTTASTTEAVTLEPTLLPSASPPPPRVLTICLGEEPKSLFLYQAFSQAERSVLQAIYDGPVDVLKDGFHPIILTKKPTFADGDVAFVALEVLPGTMLEDANGQLTTLQVGTPYYPSGCLDSSCVQTYSGDQAVSLDQVVIRFSLLPDLRWADGSPLTADDSVYSYEIAKSLFMQGQFSRLDTTSAYQALDAQTVEWRGIPGYRDVEPLANFFSPLPRHAWGAMSVEELLVDERSAQKPLGWGPYQVIEWTPGDHIRLEKNPNYFRSTAGLPYFDHLVYRFVKNGNEALDALVVGECDLIDPSAAVELELPRLQALQQKEQLVIRYQQDVAWELLAFGIDSLNPERPAIFSQIDVRQAVAMCMDRQQLVSELMYDQANILDSYLPTSHPLHASNLVQYSYDPQAAADLFRDAGWLDTDGNPSTPRTASGVPGVADGTPFEVTYLVSSDAERQSSAQMIQTMLAACGVKLNVEFQEPAVYLADGPAGPVFGRDFDMAQFAIPVLLTPPCQFFTSQEIPGPYPTFPKAWGGMNVSGYRNPLYDSACLAAKTGILGTETYQQAYSQTQVIFAQELPVLPLYTRFKVMVARPEVCPFQLERAFGEPFWDLEMLDKGDQCQP